MKVDIGCGKRKQPGFMGLDLHAYPGVDRVCNLNKGIPLKNNTVDELMASYVIHLLQEPANLMREIYRVCRHKAKVCITSPYVHNTWNLANPKYRYLMDEQEHTPITLGTGLDFRPIRVEYRYAPPYHTSDYSQMDRDMLQQSLYNVVEEIRFDLVVVKEPITEEELEELRSQEWGIPVGFVARGQKAITSLAEPQPQEPQAEAAPADPIPIETPASATLPPKRLPTRPAPVGKKTVKMVPKAATKPGLKPAVKPPARSPAKPAAKSPAKPAVNAGKPADRKASAGTAASAKQGTRRIKTRGTRPR